MSHTSPAPYAGSMVDSAADPATQSSEPACDEPQDNLVQTEHTLEANGRVLSYTATTGRMVLREEVFDGDTFTGAKDKAEVFVTSYVVHDRDTDDNTSAPSSVARPVTFAFNGGPGSSSVWLHLGLLGPRRVDMGDVDALLPPPARLVDNASHCSQSPTWCSSTR